MGQLDGSNNINSVDNNNTCTADTSNSYSLTKKKLETYNLKDVVRLPEGEDTNEWLAGNACDFFKQVGMLYGTIAESCDDKTCPTMSAGSCYEYQWIDVEKTRRPIRYNAKQYIHHLMDWIEEKLNDEQLFPSNCHMKFPENFFQECKIIFKRLFRVYAHVYHNHYEHVKLLHEEAHMNTSFKHFIYFVQEFNLIEDRELAPLKHIISKFIVPN